MLRMITIGATLLFVLQSARGGTAADNVPRKNKPLRLGVGLLDGDVLGSYRWKKHGTANSAFPPTRPVPNYHFLRFVWDGEHLQVHPLEEDRRKWSKEEVAKDAYV